MQAIRRYLATARELSKPRQELLWRYISKCFGDLAEEAEHYIATCLEEYDPDSPCASFLACARNKVLEYYAQRGRDTYIEKWAEITTQWAKCSEQVYRCEDELFTALLPMLDERVLQKIIAATRPDALPPQK